MATLTCWRVVKVVKIIGNNLDVKTDMQIWACVTCKSYIFGWVGWDGAGCVLNHFIFVTEKSITFKKRKYQKDRKKPNLCELTDIMWSTVSTVKILLSENEMHRYHAFRCLLCRRCLVSSHNALYFPFEREHVAWRDQITLTKETTRTAVPPREKVKILLLQLVSPKI